MTLASNPAATIMLLPLVRVHWLSYITALVMLIPSVYCQVFGQVYRDREACYFGWPFVHPDNAYRFYSNAFLLDLFAAVLIAASTGFVMQKLIEGIRKRAKVRLATLFLWTAVIAAVLRLFCWQGADRIHCEPVDFIDHRAIFDPIAVRYPTFIMLMVLCGLSCFFYTVIIYALRGLANVRRTGNAV